MPRRSRPARRATLVVHIAVSVGWFGLTLGLLILGLLALSINGFTTGCPRDGGRRLPRDEGLR
ncbi:hypothetical protein [Streptomyces celluloflavus]|uniref:hypothetical protein n=1 Tax=Streptomyces celluloflavus TaxID=58344 RepID=UPI0036627944